MPTALPSAITAVASTATQGDVKNWITGVHDYLAGLFGTSGAVSDALTALGLGAGSTNLNGQVFTSSGTFTVPAGVTALKVTIVGGGGGGNDSNAGQNGGAGGTSSFGAYVSSGGGGGATGGGDGSIGTNTSSSYDSVPNIIYGKGAGGHRSGDNYGGYGLPAVKFITGLTPGATVTVTIGAGGISNGGANYYSGSAGACVVEW